MKASKHRRESASAKSGRGSTPPSGTSDDQPRSVALTSLFVALLTALIYLVVSSQGRFQWTQTQFAHQMLMADALMHGQLHIRPQAMDAKRDRIARRIEAQLDEQARKTGRPISAEAKSKRALAIATNKVRHDWTPINGKYYGYWGPLTPALMIPFIVVFGPGVSDQLINIIFGSINVGLFYWLLSRVNLSGLYSIERPCRIALTVLYAFGTSHMWLTCAGQIWFSVQIVTQTFVLLAMVAICSPKDRLIDAALAGAALGAALLGRSVVLSMGLFFALLIFCRWRESQPKTTANLLLRASAFLLPVIVALGLHGLYNHGRFGDIRESGLEPQIKAGGNPRFFKDFQQYGAMSAHFVPHNFKYYFWNLNFPQHKDGRRWFDREGNSVFLMTPPLLYMFLAWRRWNCTTTAALAGAVPLIAVLMTFLGTGWIQFGPRYLLDCTPMLLLIAIAGMGGRLTHAGFILIAAAIVVQLFGTPRMLESAAGQPAEWWATLTSVETLIMLFLMAILARLGWAAWRAATAQANSASHRF